MRKTIIFLILLAGLAAWAFSHVAAQTPRRPPNIIIIFCDDLGYGDLGSYGHPTIRTPNLDRMAAEGQRWTNFYACDSVCTPSRAGLLTGRLPVRNGMTNDASSRRVLFPDSAGGLPQEEITIAELLKHRGYATAHIGKWHLGHLPQYLPTRHGFNSYFGIPYSNDMDWTGGAMPPQERRRRTMNPQIEYWNVPLLRNEEVIERPAEQATLTRRYTEEAIGFIKANRRRPFFLYLAHTMPHMPLFRSQEFEGRSLRGVYGDVIEELDWSMGRVLETLRQLKLDRQTLVVFTSDNGPWAVYNEQGGSAGLLRGAKGGTFEGGMRVPAIFWGPGLVKRGVVAELGSTLDLLPTLCGLAGVTAPADRVLDGYDLTAALRGTGHSPRQTMFYHRGVKLYAVRHGEYKAHFYTRAEYGADPEVAQSPPLLYNLEHDPSEKFDIAAQNPEVVAELRRIAVAHLQTIEPVKSQLDERLPAETSNEAVGDRAQTRKPNIILIMADDLGYETIGANGGTSYKTPVLDKLAATGARFTNCYAQPLCTPTRVQLMTGQSNVRNYVMFGMLDTRAVTFGNLLKQAGYATGIVGKWQLGRDAELPKKFGFDESCLWQHTRRPPRYANPGLEINGVPKDYDNGEYGPDLVSDYALDFITRKKDGPFFLYYPMILTHDPYQPTPDSPDWDPRARGEQANRNVKHFGEMVSYMDKLIGRLVAKLDGLGIRDNTLILFLGDNGTGRGASSMMGDKTIPGGKGLTTTFGMRVPLIANWPGNLAAGKVHTDLVDTTDFLPTLMEVAGVKPSPDVQLDGRSFLPLLRGQPGEPRKWIYSWYSRRQLPNVSMEVREFAFNDRFKLYRTGEFFDLGNDIEEKSPLSVASLKGEAAAAAKLLQEALDRYRDARPAELDRMFEQAIESRKK
jgi:arylsulfatase A